MQLSLDKNTTLSLSLLFESEKEIDTFLTLLRIPEMGEVVDPKPHIDMREKIIFHIKRKLKEAEYGNVSASS